MKNFLYKILGGLDVTLKIAYIDPNGQIQSKRWPSIIRRQDVKVYRTTKRAEKKIKKQADAILLLEEQISPYELPFVPSAGDSRNVLRANYQAQKLLEKEQPKLQKLKKKLKALQLKKESEEERKVEQLKLLELKYLALQAHYEFGCKAVSTHS